MTLPVDAAETLVHILERRHVAYRIVIANRSRMAITFAENESKTDVRLTHGTRPACDRRRKTHARREKKRFSSDGSSGSLKATSSPAIMSSLLPGASCKVYGEVCCRKGCLLWKAHSQFAMFSRRSVLGRVASLFARLLLLYNSLIRYAYFMPHK